MVKKKRTSIGIELVRQLAEEGDRIFTTDRARQVAPEVGLKNEYLWEALHHLRNNGWIVSLRRGLYAISSSTPGVNPAHEYEIAMALVEPAAISHWSAMHYHGLTDQIPRRVFVLTTTDASVPQLRGNRKRVPGGRYPVGDFVYQFIQVRPERYFGVEKVWLGDARVAITDRERTLLDGLARPKYCGDFAEVLHAFEQGVGDIDLDKITRYALRLDAATAKRLGWILERLGIEDPRLRRLADLPIHGFRTLDPTGPRKGRCNKRWMIQENLPGKVRA